MHPLQQDQHLIRSAPICSRISLHLKTQLVQLLYDKSLQLSGSARSALGVGAIVNLQSNDASKIWSLPTYGHVLWNGPFQVGCLNPFLMCL
jgi:ATP-binding cassette subfamily C (CFTR/MRP) protein 1